MSWKLNDWLKLAVLAITASFWAALTDYGLGTYPEIYDVAYGFWVVWSPGLTFVYLAVLYPMVRLVIGHNTPFLSTNGDAE